jgi:hypothetical protein
VEVSCLAPRRGRAVLCVLCRKVVPCRKLALGNVTARRLSKNTGTGPTVVLC